MACVAAAGPRMLREADTWELELPQQVMVPVKLDTLFPHV